MYSFPNSWTFAAFTIASAASTAPTKPLVSTIPSASRAISVRPHFFKIVEVKKQNRIRLCERLQATTLRVKNQDSHDREIITLTTFVGGRYIATTVANYLY